MDQARARVAVLTIDDPLYLPRVFLPLFESPRVEVVLLVRIPLPRAINMHPGGALGLESMARRLRLYGPTASIKFACAHAWIRARSLVQPDLTLRAIARRRGIRSTLWRLSINDESLLEAIRHSRPDLLLGVFSEKAGPGLLYASERGLILLHYSLLPAFAGREPVFWTLLEDPERGGISFFAANDRFDQGRVILLSRMDQSGARTLHQAIRRLSDLAAGSIVEAVSRAMRGQEEHAKGGIPPSTRSWPKAEDVRRFRGKRLRFI